VRGGQEANGIHQSGGDYLAPIISRNNRYYVEGYVYYIGDSRGQDYDQDCFDKSYTVTDNFAKWSGTYYPTLAAFQAGTGQEAHSCAALPTPGPPSSPTVTPTATVTPIACEALDFNGDGQLTVVGDVRRAYQGRIGEVCE
jgi:hypothetical protein